MKYLPIIGLEIHVQLKTDSKMFCGCANRFEEDVRVNTNICPVCTGQPGVLPVPNQRAIEYSVKAALALNCNINEVSKFDRKNYFYPDLPKGYQISQFDQPIGEHGAFTVEVPLEDGLAKDANKKNSRLINKKIGITRLHLEEDAAKLLHRKDKSLVDYNRSSAPLAEIVTEPDMRSPAEAKVFLQELRLLMRYLGVSDADMEKGQLRCDVNISLLPLEDKDDVDFSDVELNPKTEIKNVNSFRSVERALVYEIKRQTDLWEKGTPPNVLTTRGWNDVKGETTEQRIKEEAHDYRYFPEPDIPPMNLGVIAQKTRLPELPSERRVRFEKEYGFGKEEIEMFVHDKALGNYAETVYSEFGAWLQAEKIEIQENKIKAAKLVGGWITNKLVGLMSDKKITIQDIKITPENFAELLVIIFQEKVNSSNATKLLSLMLLSNSDPSHLMEEHGFGQVRDIGAIIEVVKNVIEQNPSQVTAYKNGKESLMKFFVGMCMKATEGAADPKMCEQELEKQLGEFGE